MHSVDPHKSRSLFLIRSNILTDQWKQIEFSSSDVMVIQLSSEWGSMTIYNVYNDCDKNDTICQLEAFNYNNNNKSPVASMTSKMDMTIWMGDFNRHRPHWDNPNDVRLFTKQAIDDAEILISAVAEVGLDMALPLGVPTHLHNVTKRWTRLDQVFIMEEALDSVIACETLAETPGINTDHIPILTTIDLELSRATISSPKNFRDIDWEEFQKKLVERLNLLPWPTCITSQGELDNACRRLTEAIQKTIDEEVPTSKLGVKAK